jgi:aromatic-amino-acid transaminase
MPPDHGGAVVRLILEDAELTKSWLNELDVMRARMNEVRAKLGGAGVQGSVDFAPFGTQNGLFSIVPLPRSGAGDAREAWRVHGRFGPHQRGGLTMGNIDKFIAAVADVTA